MRSDSLFVDQCQVAEAKLLYPLDGRGLVVVHKDDALLQHQATSKPCHSGAWPHILYGLTGEDDVQTERDLT